MCTTMSHPVRLTLRLPLVEPPRRIVAAALVGYGPLAPRNDEIEIPETRCSAAECASAAPAR